METGNSGKATFYKKNKTVLCPSGEYLMPPEAKEFKELGELHELKESGMY